MRVLFSIAFTLLTLTTFGQKNVRKAYILTDGKPTTYKEYKKTDLTKFPEIKILAGNEDIIKIFGKKAKNGIVHLKSSGFIDNQKDLLNELKKEFEENKLETTLLVINGVPMDSSQISSDTINKLNAENIEIIFVPDMDTIFNHRNKKVIVVTTNVTI